MVKSIKINNLKKSLDWSQKTVLVTGGNGFLGSNVVNILKEKNVGVYIYISNDAVYEVSIPKSSKRPVFQIEVPLKIVCDVVGISPGEGRADGAHHLEDQL